MILYQNKTFTVTYNIVFLNNSLGYNTPLQTSYKLSTNLGQENCIFPTHQHQPVSTGSTAAEASCLSLPTDSVKHSRHQLSQNTLKTYKHFSHFLESWMRLVSSTCATDKTIIACSCYQRLQDTMCIVRKWYLQWVVSII